MFLNVDQKQISMNLNTTTCAEITKCRNVFQQGLGYFWIEFILHSIAVNELGKF